MPMLALLVTLATAAAAPLDASPEWRTALALLDEFAYEDALRHLAPLAEDEARPASERATVLVRMAMIEADLRREAEARARLRHALELDRDARLPETASPRMRELIEEIRVVLPAPSTDRGEATPRTSTDVTASGSENVVSGAADDGVLPLVAPTLLISGALVTAGGLAAWGTGIALFGVADQSHYQSDAVALGDGGAAAQVAGQVMVALGVVVLASGTAMLFLE